jgi:hypothetical protein
MPLLTAIFAAASLLTYAADPPGTSLLLAKRWFVPPGFVKDGDEAQAFLERNGISFPEGAFAKYFPTKNILLFRNTQANIELVECILGSTGPCEFPNLCAEILTREIPTDSLGNTRPADLSWDEIRQLPRDRVRPVSQVSVLAKSGLMVTAEQVDATRGHPPNPAAADKTSECRTKVSIEAVVGPDGTTVDLAYTYQIQRSFPGRDCLDVTLSGNSLLRIGTERVLAITPVESSGRALVVTVLLRQRDPCDGLLRGWHEESP